jgi:integrase/recombinase XerC
MTEAVMNAITRLEEFGDILEGPKKKRVYPNDHKFLSENEQRQLVRAVKEVKGSDTPLGLRAERDYVIIEAALNIGLRRAELAGLNVGDVRNKERMWVRPDIAKGGKGAHVPLRKHIRGVFRQFLAAKLGHRKERISDDAPLFLSRLGERMTPRAINDIVEFWMIRAGLCTTVAGKPVAWYTVHSLRHAFGKRLDERGVPIHKIRKLMRHTTIQSTAIYTEPTDEELAEAVEAI